MRLSRYISRRCWRLVQYVFFGALIVLMIPLLVGYSSKRDDEGGAAFHKAGEDGHMMPGHVAAPQQEQKPERVHVVPRGAPTPPPPTFEDDPFAKYKGLPKKDWHDYKAMEADAKRKGVGEQGVPVILPTDPETKKKQDQIYRVNGFDGLASDQVALNRSVKDIRHAKCKEKKYIEKLPSVTVAVPFHNEHWSTLLRTAYSVWLRSPKDVLKEIVLVDDFSTKEFLKKELEDYLATHFDGIAKVVRTSKREGLIRARQIGAQHSTSDIIVFLDSHSEANYNWLPPLIEPIALNYRTVVCPFVDVVDCDSFEYKPQDEGARGSFDWEFSYKRLPLLPEDHADPTKPFKSPVMAGGYFAISRKWFWELGGYDEGLDIWGGEQYELSFKVWQCHGEMFDAPCSRVGHIYRCKYVPFPNPGVGDFISRNYKRVAEVWMDEYKEHLYKRRPNMRSTDTGDLTRQKAVRERLKCKSFDWFMKDVMFDQEKFYPAIEPPDGANGELRNVAANKCVDTQFKGKEERFELRKCLKDDTSVGGEQIIRFSFWKDIRASTRSMCFDVSTSVHHAPIVLFPCHGMQGNQMWKYKFATNQLFHPVSALCLDCDAERGELFMSKCDDDAKTQKWSWDKLNRTVVESWKYEM